MKKFLPLILTNITTIILLIFVFFLYSFTHAYTTFTKEEPVAVLSFSKIEKNEYMTTLYTQDTKTLPRTYKLYGNQFQLDANFKKFKYYANFFGFDNKYELDRLSGRYKLAENENSKKHLVYDLRNNGNLILNNTLLTNIFIDVNYGSSVYTDIKENVLYKIYKTNTGFLIRKEVISALHPGEPKYHNNIGNFIKNFF